VNDYVPDIGFEIHAQLVTDTKLFCSCPNAVGGGPNTRVCPVCLGLPGALPVLNDAAAELAVRVALLMGAAPSSSMRFARKNYFYPDLPKGYQITQYESPVALGGAFAPPRDPPVRIRRVHLEEDAGKSVHGAPGAPSLIDMNRSGVPLVEIVTEPDLHDIDSADRFLKAIRRALVFIGAVTGHMHEGSIRFDTNISMRTSWSSERGTQTEIKNLNSFRAVAAALAFETNRQRALLEEGKRVAHETLLWDEDAERAAPMRSKEGESDYRYFPEPDLGSFELGAPLIARAREQMPELPWAAEQRLRDSYGLTAEQLDVLAADPGAVRYFDAAARAFGSRADHGDLITLANWVVGPVVSLSHRLDVDLGGLAADALPPERLAAVVTARVDDGITEPAARTLLDEAARSREPIAALIERLGLAPLDDESELAPIVARVIASHPEEAERWRDGERKLTRHFVGLVMRETKGRADPRRARELLDDGLSEES